MYIWPVTAVVSGQSRLGSTKIRIILNIALILHYDSCVKDRDLKTFFVESLDTNEYPSIKRLGCGLTAISLSIIVSEI